tara:strand:- start:290 stop:484 length:195 start_codon:yes stop_codon:yes gene_type:complete
MSGWLLPAILFNMGTSKPVNESNEVKALTEAIFLIREIINENEELIKGFEDTLEKVKTLDRVKN